MCPSPSEPLRFQLDAHPDLVAPQAYADLWDEWDELAERTAAPPFLRPGWFAAWQRAYGRGELRLLSVRDGADLAGVLPLRSAGRATLSATNTHSPLYAPVTTGPDAERALAAELVARCRHRLELAYVDPATTWYAALDAALRSDGRRLQVTPMIRSPYVSLDDSEDGYPASLPRRFLKDLRRRRRRLEERGLVDVTVHDGVAGLDAALREFVALESSGWKAEEGTAIASREANGRFYAEIADWAARRGWLRLAFLRLDGRPIAAELDLQCGGAVHALKSGFDPEYRVFGPGHLLTHECLAAAASERLAFYEFLGTDEPYKMSWTGTTRERVRVQAFPGSLRGGLDAFTRSRVRPLARRLRRR
jgi:CelD/BcsL family acetyltransferase involved in cellulose biosynthesis